MIPQAKENKTKHKKNMCVFEDLSEWITKICGPWLMYWILEACI